MSRAKAERDIAERRRLKEVGARTMAESEAQPWRK
jgi:hypothetical protein